MVLDFVCTRRINEFAVVKEYNFGSFHLVVTLDQSGYSDITATESGKRIRIHAVNWEPAHASVVGTFLTGQEDLEEFTNKLDCATELVGVIEANRERLLHRTLC